MCNFSFALTWLNTGKVIGFYVLISLHKNPHNRQYHITVTTQQTMQETKFLLEKQVFKIYSIQAVN